MKKAVLLGLAAFFAVGIGFAIFGGDPGPDADQQEEVATNCLRAADFKVKSEIPPNGARGHRNPDYELEVSQGGDVIAYIYLFDIPEEVDGFLEDAKFEAEDEGEKLTLEKRGSAAVDVFGSARTTARIRGCVDKASDRPERSGA